MKHLFTLFLFSVLSNQLLAQGGTIVSFSINPTNPVEGDDIEVYADVTFPYSGCDLEFIAFPLNGTDILATAHHCNGLLTAICNTTDTFELGQLPAGDYNFDLTLTNGQGGPGCSPGIVPDDNDQFQFTVSPAVGIDEVENLDGFAYPNPLVDVMNLKRPLANTAIITDASGKRVAEIASGNRQIDLSQFPEGVYILHVSGHHLKLLKQ